MIVQSLNKSRLNTSRRSFKFENEVKIVCDDDKRSMLTINKSVKIDTIDAAFKDAFWVNDKFVICVNENVVV